MDQKKTIHVLIKGIMLSIPIGINLEKLDAVTLEGLRFACLMAATFGEGLKEKRTEIRKFDEEVERILNRQRLADEI